MIGIPRKRIYRIAGLPAAALILVLTGGPSTQAAWASSSQVCGNYGTGYCLNDWGGGGASGNAIKMYYGGTVNDDFYVQEVNRCGGSDTVTSTERGDSTNCPFSNADLDYQMHGATIVQITYTNNVTQCVASTSSFGAVLGDCADPLSGSGGANGVIMVLDNKCAGDWDFVDRYAADNENGGYLTSGGNPGVQASFTPALVTCWGGSEIFGP